MFPIRFKTASSEAVFFIFDNKFIERFTRGLSRSDILTALCIFRKITVNYSYYILNYEMHSSFNSVIHPCHSDGF